MQHTCIGNTDFFSFSLSLSLSLSLFLSVSLRFNGHFFLGEPGFAGVIEEAKDDGSGGDK